jgi:hypothetical protein
MSDDESEFEMSEKESQADSSELSESEDTVDPDEKHMQIIIRTETGKISSPQHKQRGLISKIVALGSEKMLIALADPEDDDLKVSVLFHYLYHATWGWKASHSVVASIIPSSTRRRNPTPKITLSALPLLRWLGYPRSYIRQAV